MSTRGLLSFKLAMSRMQRKLLRLKDRQFEVVGGQTRVFAVPRNAMSRLRVPSGGRRLELP